MYRVCMYVCTPYVLCGTPCCVTEVCACKYRQPGSLAQSSDERESATSREPLTLTGLTGLGCFSALTASDAGEKLARRKGEGGGEEEEKRKEKEKEKGEPGGEGGGSTEGRGSTCRSAAKPATQTAQQGSEMTSNDKSK